MFYYQQTNSESFVNPTLVPMQRVLRIYSDDPRNNQEYIKSCGMVVEVVDRATGKLQSIENNLQNFDEYSDPGSENLTEIIPPTDNNTNGPGINPNLKAPTNLNIDLSSLTVVYADDGSTSYTVTLTFDDVDGAVEYSVYCSGDGE